MSRTARAEEQDAAAGGRERRFTPDGASASVALRVQPKGRSLYAYLRWWSAGKTHERFISEVREDTREGNLRTAWRAASDRGLLAPPGSTTSWAGDDGTRAIMQANRGRDTRPELAVRSLLHRRGLRYRTNARPLPGLRRTADVVFTRAKVAVFVDGCYWHGCPQHCRPASRNSAFWADKIATNAARDRETDSSLSDAGWLPLRFWEHEPAEIVADAVEQAVRDRILPTWGG